MKGLPKVAETILSLTVRGAKTQTSEENAETLPTLGTERLRPGQTPFSSPEMGFFVTRLRRGIDFQERPKWTSVVLSLLTRGGVNPAP
jgi:hypothetical protein